MMDAKDIFSNTEAAYNLRATLDDLIKDLPYHIKCRMSLFLDTVLINTDIDFEDIKKRGAYEGLLLGSENASIFNEFIGIQPSFFVNDDAPYLIEIAKTFRDTTIQFEFLDQEGALSEKKQGIIVRLFKKYNPDTNIEKFLGTAKLPSLVVKNKKPDVSFLSEPDDDIKLLLGENLIQKVKIGITGNKNYCPIRSLHIITPAFFNLNGINKDTFINLFEKQLFSYNFIIINHENDFLIKLFFDSIAQFEEKHEIKNTLNGLYRLLFFVKQKSFLSDTRLLNENPEYSRFLSTEYESDIAFKYRNFSFVHVLNYLILLCSAIKEKAINDSLPELPALILQESFKTFFDEYRESIANDITKVLPSYQELKNNFNDFQGKYKKPADYLKRESFFVEYESYLNDLHNFIKKFSQSRESEISKCIFDISSDKINFLEKGKHWWDRRTYLRIDSEFKNFVISKIAFLENIIENIINDIQIESTKPFFTEVQKQNSTFNNLVQLLGNELLISRLENKTALELIQLMDKISISS